MTRSTVETLVSQDPATQNAPTSPMSRRRFLGTTLLGCAGLALYSGEIERHWIETTHREIRLKSLPSALDGLRIVQLSDIHLDEFTEPFLLRQAIEQVNRMRPDVVVLTGDFVSYEIAPRRFSEKSAWHCAEMLSELRCLERYAILGNHDHWLSGTEVARALSANAIPVLINSHVPIERNGSRLWLAGIDDPVSGRPDPDRAIPSSIRNIEGEPLVLMCQAPDYADELLAHPAGKSIGLMLSGHTHSGQGSIPICWRARSAAGWKKVRARPVRCNCM